MLKIEQKLYPQENNKGNYIKSVLTKTNISDILRVSKSLTLNLKIKIKYYISEIMYTYFECETIHWSIYTYKEKKSIDWKSNIVIPYECTS